MHPQQHASRPLPTTPTAARSGILVSRRAVFGAGFGVAMTIAWAGAATWYIAFRDDIAQRVFVRETEMRFAYEDRIAHMATRLEREITQNLVERRTFDSRVAAVAARQAEIEARQAWLRTAAEQAGLAASPDLTTVLSRRPDRAMQPKAAAATGGPAPVPELRLRNERADTGTDRAPRDRLSALETKLEAARADEIEIVKALGRAARTRLSQMRSVLDATGLDLSAPSGRDGGIGGPLVPIDAKAEAGPMGFLLADLGSSMAEIRRLDSLARTLPLRRPLEGEVEHTSGFGTRFDPFTRGPALHTGVDFRAETGTPARATGAGRVVTAEYSGGYGNLVEIDHGNGVVTRYGHLMSFLVSPGDQVAAGQVIALTGSTGRSTGPHLHYETRVAGEAVNPIRFLEAGRLMGRTDG